MRDARSAASDSQTMPLLQALAPALKRQLVGFLPVYKPSGLRRIDLLDNIRLTLSFELEVKTTNRYMILDCRPRLRKGDAGIVHTAFGAKARSDLGLWKHADMDYNVTAVLGERLTVIAYDGVTSRPYGG